MKRIVIGCDGTWNKPEQTDRGKRKPTNIVKLIRAVKPEDDLGTPQIAFYDKGLGTHWGLSKWVEGVTGYGISSNILDAYEFICHNYVPGDQLYLFGFSRGAFTARSLVGLLTKVGILPKQNVFFMPEAYDLYRAEADATEFRRVKGCLPATVRFLGVFDTVGALGIPVGPLNFLTAKHHAFHDVSLSPIVEKAYHALAIDERRGSFAPTLWDSDTEISTSRLEQVWYAGVHTNIGGGYELDGLANIPLHSVKKRAASCGLDFDDSFLAPYKPNPTGELRDSAEGIFRLGKRIVRGIGTTKNGNESIHPSVAVRMRNATLGYLPPNVGNQIDHA